MQLRVLGHLEVSIDDRAIAVGGAKPRAVLAMLGLEANRTVTADRLIEGLWGEDPPASAGKMVQNYVWRLRKVLAGDGGAEILTHGRGYELRIDRERVDACRLERLVADAARSAGSSAAGDGARAALALFRGEPLADVADEPFAQAEIRRLEELRLTAAELAIDADLAAGRHQEVVGEIDALLADNPLRERLHAQRMLTLYRCGRQAEALEAYRDARRTLVEEIGVEPAPELRRLHDAILRQDPSLDVEPAAAELPRELDAAGLPALIGRAADLRRIRARWQRAAAGSGALVTVTGPYGIGKTRLAAELAGEAHREGAVILHAAGSGPPEAVLAATARLRETRRPALLVIDDVDRAPADARAALRELARELTRLPALVLATGEKAAALARLEPAEAIALAPLDEHGVRAIAGFYAPGGDDVAVPLLALLDASGGVPRRVHEAAGEWARREATRRVDVAADRAAAGRTEARALEAELAGSVVDLQSTRERSGAATHRAGDGHDPVVCPYKGLATFDADDAEYFFGRERLVAELVARLVGAPLLAVVGPSGSGKSSVVRAGLMPALAGGVLPRSDNWAQALIRPGEHPARTLQLPARKLAREWRGVLVVDQFEELFTACRDEAERREFVASLVRIARETRGRTSVVIAIRADFYGRCAAYPELSRLLGANQVLVGPMTREELRRAIERPAQRAGLAVEPELVEALLADVDAQPGALPLLSTALLELWRRREGRQLRLAAYARSGGVEGAVARLAEAAYLGLDPERRELARMLFLRLADDGEGGAVVRRRVALADLDVGGADVVARLADSRLITVSDGAVEVAHEALLREWPRLREWLDEDVEGRRLHRGLSDAARAWDADARDPGGLYRGARLVAALDWAAGHERELNATERQFLDDSRRASGRAQRRLRAMLAGVAALLVVAVIAGLVALEQRGNARAEATAAAAQRLGAQALADDDLDRALLLARQGVALDDSPQTRGNLFAALLKSPAAVGAVRGGDALTGLVLSADDRTLLLAGADGMLTVVDTRTRGTSDTQQLAGLVVPDVAFADALKLSDDGRLIAIGGGYPAVLDARTRRIVARLPIAEGEVVTRLAFSRDGRTVFAALWTGPHGNTRVRRFEVRSGRRLGREWYQSGLTGVTLMALRDGRLVTSSAGRTVIRDGRTLRPLRQFTAGSAQAVLSPDDRTVLVGGRDGSVRFLDLVTGELRMAAGRHDGRVVRAVFSADGRTAVTAGQDRHAIVWDVERAAAGETLAGHAGMISGLALSRDGRTLYTSALDGKAIVWDLDGGRRLGRPVDIGRGSRGEVLDGTPSISSAMRPDGRVLAVGRLDGTVVTIDARTLERRTSFRAVPRGPMTGMAYMPGGRLLVVGGDGYLALVDPRSGELVRRLGGHSSYVVTPSFSADGRLMATADAGGVVKLWTLRDGRPVGTPRPYYASQVIDASLSPDGRTLALANAAGIDIVDVDTLRVARTLPESETAAFLARFTPDGRFLVGGSYKGWARLWSTRTWQPATGELGGHTREVLWQSVTTDGSMLATGSPDGTIRLFDLRTQQPIGAPLPGIPDRPIAPQFTPDGGHLFTITNAGRAHRWDLRPSSWAQHACSVAGRALTREEWDAVLPGRDYEPACTG